MSRLAAYMHGMAEQVDDLLAATGLKSDPHGVTASGPAMARPAGEWREAIAGWLDKPTDETLMAISILLDGRSIDGPDRAFGVFAAVRDGERRPSMLRLLLRLALAIRPPTGFLHDIVVEHSGEHRGSFDIKRGGLLPIVGIARYAGLAAGAEVHVHGLAAASRRSGGRVARIGCDDAGGGLPADDRAEDGAPGPAAGGGNRTRRLRGSEGTRCAHPSPSARSVPPGRFDPEDASKDA